jgi:hypothetical protein
MNPAIEEHLRRKTPRQAHFALRRRYHRLLILERQCRGRTGLAELYIDYILALRAEIKLLKTILKGG